jgi:hypothetical protein
MTEQQLLARLRDIHPPPEPQWWPPAPGWWILLLAIVVLAALAIRYSAPRLARWRKRTRLLRALDAVERRHRAGANDVRVAAEVSQLLRLAALERFPGQAVAGLHGEQWIRFLESCDRAPGRFARLRDALTVAPYRQSAAGEEAEPLLEAARGWLRAVI